MATDGDQQRANVEIARALGEITGKLSVIIEQQNRHENRLGSLHDGQSLILQKVTHVESVQATHSTRLTSVESKVGDLEKTSVRNATLAGMAAGTGAALIAEALRHFIAGFAK